MSKNRVPFAVKIAKTVLNHQLVLKKEYDPKIVFEEDMWSAIANEIDDLKPETLGRIIAYGGAHGHNKTHTSVYDGVDSKFNYPRANGTVQLKMLAMSVIRAAMMDIIKENNARLTKAA